jgi:hypothetical protein
MLGRSPWDHGCSDRGWAPREFRRGRSTVWASAKRHCTRGRSRSPLVPNGTPAGPSRSFQRSAGTCVTCNVCGTFPLPKVGRFNTTRKLLLLHPSLQSLLELRRFRWTTARSLLHGMAVFLGRIFPIRTHRFLAFSASSVTATTQLKNCMRVSRGIDVALAALFVACLFLVSCVPSHEAPDTGTDAAVGADVLEAASAFLNVFDRERCALAARCNDEGAASVARIEWPPAPVECHPGSPFRRPAFLPNTVELVACRALEFDAIAADQCLAELTAGTCERDLSDPSWLRVCARAFITPDGSCGFWAGCPAGQTCLDSRDCLEESTPLARDCPAHCEPEAGLGEECDISPGPPVDTECAFGLVCGEPTCRSGLVEGEDCSPIGGLQHQCAFPLRCAGSLRCIRLRVAGEPCGQGDCVQSAFCDSLGVCVERLALGERCDVTGTRCGGDARCLGGVCVPVALPGDPCGGGAACVESFHCVGGLCEQDPGFGGACSPELPCAAGLCTDGTCTPRAPGDPCVSSARECEPFCAGICPRIADPGQPCDIDPGDHVPVVCPSGSYCERSTHTCLPHRVPTCR